MKVREKLIDTCPAPEDIPDSLSSFQQPVMFSASFLGVYPAPTSSGGFHRPLSSQGSVSTNRQESQAVVLCQVSQGEATISAQSVS